MKPTRQTVGCIIIHACDMPPRPQQPLPSGTESQDAISLAIATATVVEIPRDVLYMYIAVPVIPERPDTVTVCQLLGLDPNPIVAVDVARAIVRADVVRQCDRHCPSVAAWGACANGATGLKLYGRCQLLGSANRRLKALCWSLRWFGLRTIWYRWCTTNATSVVGMFILAWHDKRLAYLSRSCRKKSRPVMATRDLSIAATVVQSVHRTAENPKRTRRAGTAGPAGQATRRCAVNTGNTQHQHPLPMATTRLSPLRAEEHPGVGTPNLTENAVEGQD